MKDDGMEKSSEQLIHELEQLREESVNLKISQRKLRITEKALWESREKYRILVETAADAIFTVSIDGTFLSANTEAGIALGRDAKDMIGKKMEALFPADIAERNMKSIRNVFQTGEAILAMEDVAPTVKGMRWYNTTLVPFKDKTGNVIFVFGIARDVTDTRNVCGCSLQHNKGRS